MILKFNIDFITISISSFNTRVKIQFSSDFTSICSRRGGRRGVKRQYQRQPSISSRGARGRRGSGHLLIPSPAAPCLRHRNSSDSSSSPWSSYGFLPSMLISSSNWSDHSKVKGHPCINPLNDSSHVVWHSLSFCFHFPGLILLEDLVYLLFKILSIKYRLYVHIRRFSFSYFFIEI